MRQNEQTKRFSLDVIRALWIPDSPTGCRLIQEPHKLDKDTDEPANMDRVFVVVQFDADPKDQAWGFDLDVFFDEDGNTMAVSPEATEVIATGYALEGDEVRKDQAAA